VQEIIPEETPSRISLTVELVPYLVPADKSEVFAYLLKITSCMIFQVFY
jgi:hypothetical protein